MPCWPSCSAGTPALSVTPTKPCNAQQAVSSAHSPCISGDCSGLAFFVKYDRGSNGTHQDVDYREDDDSIVAAPVGVCKEGSQQREDVDSAGPIGHLLHRSKEAKLSQRRASIATNLIKCFRALACTRIYMRLCKAW